MPAYLFDLDGTLIDSKDDIAHSANSVREALGLPRRPLPEIYGFIGEGVQLLLSRTLGPGQESKVEKAMQLWRDHYGRHLLDRTKTYEGIDAALARLDGKKGVLTNKPGEFARRLVDALGLAPHFGVVLGPDDVGIRKPDPKGLHEAVHRLGAADERVLYVGDSAIDAQTARNAGVAFVGVLWGFRPREELEANGARIFAEHPDELPEACARALAH